jgi:hypothetical protein
MRPSVAELRPLVFCVTCSFTFIERNSLTKSSVSLFYQRQVVMARDRLARGATPPSARHVR